jgi:hypothetical protein
MTTSLGRPDSATASARATGTRALGALIVLTGTALLLGLAASLSAAAPSYTDWITPVNLGPVVNSGVVDLGPTLSADRLSLYFASNRLGGSGGLDIYVSHRPTVTGAWGAPANLGPTINTAASESLPSFTPDGHWMFFGSAGRADTLGGMDLYRSYRPDVHDDLGWQTPVNLGPNVNTASDENAPSYLENGGSPQLYFGSAKPGGLGLADLYVSKLQADGSWGPAVALTELNSSANDNRPNIRSDGLQILFYSDRVAGGLGSNDLWSSTRPTVDDAWSAPVNLGPPVNSAASDQHPFLTEDGRTLFFTSARSGGVGAGDIWMTTRDAALTVTATNQSRLFGQTNPPLTYAITGFVGGETSTVVSGTAACTTIAAPFSPAGYYPITCTAGTLSAAGYVFTTFVSGTLNVSYTSPCLDALRNGPLTAAAGETVCIGAGAIQTGPVAVAPGASLDVEGGKIIGPITATGAAAVRICGATLTGPLTITGSTGLVLVGGDATTGPCDANTIVGPVRVTDNAGGVELNGNLVVGPLRIVRNTGSLPTPDTGSVHADDNTVTGPSTIQS